MPPYEIALPTDAELPELLRRLGAEPADAADLIASVPVVRENPEIWGYVRDCAQALIDDMGGYAERPPMPAMPGEWGEPGRYFYAYVFLAVAPHVRAYHLGRGIPDDLSWLALAGFGGHLANHRRDRGVGGLAHWDWLTLAFRGGIYQLGRLQFNRGRLDRFAAAVQEAGVACEEDDYALGVHIPGGSGPLDPAACDASFDRARGFFARHFPEEPYRFARCGSWLLDDQLAGYLPEDANILAFQRRFRLTPELRDGADEFFGAVFGVGPAHSRSDLPRRTALQRAVLDHLAAGRHWHTRFGWLEL
jgi:hypothetical protein